MSLLDDEWNKAIDAAAGVIDSPTDRNGVLRMKRPSPSVVDVGLVVRLTGVAETKTPAEILGLAHVIADHAFWTGDEPAESRPYFALEHLRTNLATVTRNFYASLGGARIQIEVKHGTDPDGERRITGAVVTLFSIPFAMDEEVFSNLVGACLAFKSQIIEQQKRDEKRRKATEKAAKGTKKTAAK